MLAGRERTTPLAAFTVPSALLLHIIFGGSARAVAVMALFARRRIALFEQWRVDALASAVAGGTVVCWMTIAITTIGLDQWEQAAAFIAGLVLLGPASLAP